MKDTQKKKVLRASRVGALTIATGAIATALIFFAIASLSSYLDDKLQDLSEQYALDVTNQLGNLSYQSIKDTKRALDAFTVETDNPEQLLPALSSLRDGFGFTWAAFFNMDGEGIYNDGSPANVADLNVEDTALTNGEPSRSAFYLDSVGAYAQIGQKPLYIDGHQVGALYAEIPVDSMSPIVLNQKDSYTKYYFVFDQETGAVLDTDDQSDALPEVGMSVYDYIARSIETQQNNSNYRTKGASDSVVEGVEEVHHAVQQEREAIIVAAIDGQEFFICFAPIGDAGWYVGNLVLVDEVRADASIVSSVLSIVFALVVVCLILSLAVAVLMYRRETQNKEDEMKQHLYQALSDSLDFSVNLYCPADGTTTHIVAKTADIFGVSFDTLINHPELARKLKVSAQGRAMLLELRDGLVSGPVLRGTFSFVELHSERERYVEYVVRPLRYEDKDQLLVLFRDVSASKTIEMSMKDAMTAADAANRAKSEFLMRMSHEIRTPMNVIIGKLAIAQKHLGDPDKAQKSLNDIDEAAEHLLKLINEILDISKIESGKANYVEAPFNLNDLIESVKTMFEPQCSAKSQVLVYKTEGQVNETFVGDAMRLRQVLMNLLSNAVKYTPDGGTIEFATRVSKSFATGYRTITFTVKDNGIGMTKEYLERLYEPFAQEGRVQTEGTGLGMPIVKNIVNSMGGGIHVESKLNKGTTFTVVLSKRLASAKLEDNEIRHTAEIADAGLMDENAQHALEDAQEHAALAAELEAEVKALEEESETAAHEVISPSPTEKVQEETYILSDEEAAEAFSELQSETLPAPGLFDFSQLRLLLVEDSDLNADIATELLSDEGITVEWAEDGKVGLEKFAESPEGHYDLILMDIRMPNMNGYESTQAIRSLERPDAQTIPIVAMSANAFADDVLASLKSGMNAHLTKPIAIRQVLSTIAVELEKTNNVHLKRKS